MYEMAEELAKVDKTFLECIRKEIKERAKEYGIDEKKFCFDIDKVKSMQEYDRRKGVENNTVTVSMEKSIDTEDMPIDLAELKNMKLSLEQTLEELKNQVRNAEKMLAQYSKLIKTKENSEKKKGPDFAD